MSSKNKRIQSAALATAAGLALLTGSVFATPIRLADVTPLAMPDSLGVDANGGGGIRITDLTEDPDAALAGHTALSFVNFDVFASMAIGAPGANVVPRDRGEQGIPVGVPATWALLLAGVLAWKATRHLRRAA